MITFKQGPADGKSLNLQRVPIYLRVVVDDAGAIDALDQIDDSPRPSETVYAYKLLEHRGTAHIDGRDPKTGKRYGKWIQIASYQLCEDQPTPEESRDTTAWQSWVMTQAGKENP